ncbi:MAG: rod shape-determining protein RodA [Peptococcaceae bacterium]|nr:rod shape-determining protein RodA [Peptococcaceae bacterium]
MNFYRKLIGKMDFILLAVIAVILVSGLLILNSAAASKEQAYVMKQSMWIVIGIVFLLLTIQFDYTILQKYVKPLYIFNLLLLIAVLIFGREISGARSWFVFPGIGSLQPAELAKIMTIICFAHFLDERRGNLNTLWELIPCFIFVAIPVFLILLQPDLGSALVFIAILVGMMFVAGANPKILLTIFGGGVSIILIYLLGVWKLGWWCPLKTYQLNRFLVLFDPNIDPRGVGYNVWQAKIAIGNGGLFGEGLGMGSQTTGSFLPEQWTDFIFAVYAEEFGFIGAGLLLLLFAVLLYRGLRIAMLSKDLFGALIATGVVSMYLFHILENVGMCMGLMPVTGIPLPFVSYGGSSMLANFFGIALLQNIYVHRQRLIF